MTDDRREGLTGSQAAAIRILLACNGQRERGWMSDVGLGSRSFERTKHEAYAERWVIDRFLPNFGRLHIRSVAFVLERPYAQDLAPLEQSWRNRTDNVLLWRWPETLFGVFFSDLSREGLLETFQGQRAKIQTATVISTPTSRCVPVYFDWEGAWSRLTGHLESLGYPHGLLDDATDASGSVIRQAVANGLPALLARRSEDQGEGRPLRVSPYFLPRSEQRLLHTRAAERRTFLEIRRVPSSPNGDFRQIGVAHGKLRPDISGSLVLRVLLAMRIRPFLYAFNEFEVFFGTVSPAPDVPTGAGPRPGVLQTLQGLLDDIQLIRQPVLDLEVVRNHDYRSLPRSHRG
jgi:hypothetical protein